MTRSPDERTAVHLLPDGREVHGINNNEIEYLYREIFEDRMYMAPNGYDLRAEPIVFDAGANIGLFSIFSAYEWPGAHIYAFEPVRQIYDVLHQNLADLAGAQSYQVGLSDKQCYTTMVYYPSFTIMSGLVADPSRDMATVRSYVLSRAQKEHDEHRCADIAASIDAVLAPRFTPVHAPCRLVTIPWLVDMIGCDRIDLLKMDIEGSEVAALRGLDEATWTKVINVVVEVTDDNDELEVVRDLLERHGLSTQAHQPAEYVANRQYIVYASR